VRVPVAAGIPELTKSKASSRDMLSGFDPTPSAEAAVSPSLSRRARLQLLLKLLLRI
jgi:hypothetical protein